MAMDLTPVFDGVTLLVCTAALYYVLRLYMGFKGSKYGNAYVYYAGAASVLEIAFLAKLILDFMGSQPENYGNSLGDAAIIGVLVLFALGLRRTREFWNPSKTEGAVPTPK